MPVTVQLDEYGRISGTYDGIVFNETTECIEIGYAKKNYEYTFYNENESVGLRYSESFDYVHNYATIVGDRINMHVENSGTISGGTFGFTIKNHDDGTISGGTFNDTVENSSIITNGIFNDLVKNYGTITGGTFSGGIPVSYTHLTLPTMAVV